MNLTKISRYISYLLRHHPEAAGLTLDEHGWADAAELAAAAGISREVLEEIVRTDEKGRYSFSPDGTLIRANQGHSIPVDVELEQLTPPETLWHGTASRFSPAIESEGLKKMSRLYVHLSPDHDTARKVGSRHGKPVVYRVAAARMAEDAYPFFRSANGVWLTEKVPAEYLVRET